MPVVCLGSSSMLNVHRICFQLKVMMRSRTSWHTRLACSGCGEEMGQSWLGVEGGQQWKGTNEVKRRTRRLTGQKGRKIGVLRVGISPVEAPLQVLGDRRSSQSGYVYHDGRAEERLVGRSNVVVTWSRFGPVASNDEDMLETVKGRSEERLPTERSEWGNVRPRYSLRGREGGRTTVARPQATGCRPGR